MQLEQEALEHKIRRNWNELKECLEPGTVAKDSINKILETKTTGNLNGSSILKSTFTYGVSLLAKKMADKAFAKFGKASKK